MHFYKQMAGSFMHSIALPEKLTPHILGLLGSVIKLKRPSGATWDVGLIRLNEKLLIQPGWENFVNENGVSPNDLLVFKYVSRIEFEVLIFDPCGCEKSGVDDITRYTSIPLVPRNKSSMSRPDGYVEKPHKMEEEIEYSKTAKISDTEAPAKKRPNQKSRKRMEASGDAYYEQHSLVMSENVEVVCNSANMDFCSLHFYKQMCGLSMHKMSLPVEIRMNFEGLIGKVLQLKRPSGNTWHVSLIWSGKELVLQSGWNQFVVANDVAHNDFLVFKFIGGSKFEVLIFTPYGREKSSNVQSEMRNGLGQALVFGTESIRSKPDNSDEKSSEIEVYGNTMEDVEGCSAGNYFLGTEQLVCGVQGKNPSFLQVLKPSSLTIQCGISIPKKFSAKHLPKESQELVLFFPEKNKVWAVRYLYSQYQQFIRYAGWGKFVNENNLQEGDICSFELVKSSQPITFVVRVSRAS